MTTTNKNETHLTKMTLREGDVSNCGGSGPCTRKLEDVDCPRCRPRAARALAEALGMSADWTEESAGKLDFSGGPFDASGPSIYESVEEASLGFLRDVYEKLGRLLGVSADDERQRLLRRIAELERDGMTALYRREVGLDLLRRLPRRRSAICIYFDLDRLKQVNDTEGHEAGDRLIQDMAASITSSMRVGDIGVRLGGDEFVVGMSLSGCTCAEDLGDRFVERVRAALARRTQCRASVSAAWSVYTESSERLSLEEALRYCDRMVIEEKRIRGIKRERAA